MDAETQKAYTSDFEAFLRHTNEKKILQAEIATEIKQLKPSSVIDIGAGNGDLSIPLSTYVPTYVALEQKNEFAEALDKAGLTTIHKSFPTNIEGRFDLILMSHSVPYEKDEVDAFIEKAWELVAPGGAMLIVTYNSKEGDWLELTKATGSVVIESGREDTLITYPELLERLEQLGKISVRKVKTTVETKTLDKMIGALSFVASNGIPKLKKMFMDRREKVETHLEAYKTADGYEFPFYHYFIIVSK